MSTDLHSDHVLTSQILANMSESIHLLRVRDASFVYVNSAFERMFGYTLDEIAGRHVALINASSAGDPVETARQIMAELGSAGVWRGEILNRRKSGEEFWSRASVTSFEHRDHGELWLAIHQDIDALVRARAEREELERRLAHSQRLESLGTLASGIAHDFSNVLQGMVLALDSALEQLGGAEGPRAELERAVALADRGRDLVKRILGFAQSDTPKLVEVDLRDIVRQTAAMLRAVLPSTIRLDQQLTGGRTLVRGDGGQLEQVLVNLCSNAAYAMRDGGGNLTITLQRARDPQTGEWAVLGVEDDGPGIAPEHRDSVFNPFYTTKPAHEGTGLGLAMVQRAVEAHGGAVDVHDRAGPGCRFEVRLPLLATCHADSGDGATQRKRRLMFVDDEEDLLEGYRTVLERRGYEVSTHTDPTEALDEFRRDPGSYDALLMDQLMPKLDGVRLSRMIDELRPGVPKLLLTGSPVLDDLDGTGISTVLHKPFRTRELLDALADMFEETEAD
jgi:PAS domain S-box-containing protein